jgi:hypothetical protein
MYQRHFHISRVWIWPRIKLTTDQLQIGNKSGGGKQKKKLKKGISWIFKVQLQMDRSRLVSLKGDFFDIFSTL